MAKKEAAAKVGLKKSQPMGAAGEICAGCGSQSTEASPFPVIGVMNSHDVPDGVTVIDNPSSDSAEDGESYVGVVACDACWRDPAHRTLNTLKVHFFERKGNAPKIGLMLAGSANVQG